MSFEHDGRHYGLYRQSDVDRDGMALELMDETERPHAPVMEVFFSDRTSEFSVSCSGKAVPLELVELVIAEAKASLPSSAKN